MVAIIWVFIFITLFVLGGSGLFLAVSIWDTTWNRRRSYGLDEFDGVGGYGMSLLVAAISIGIIYVDMAYVLPYLGVR